MRLALHSRAEPNAMPCLPAPMGCGTTAMPTSGAVTQAALFLPPCHRDGVLVRSWWVRAGEASLGARSPCAVFPGRRIHTRVSSRHQQSARWLACRAGIDHSVATAASLPRHPRRRVIPRMRRLASTLGGGGRGERPTYTGNTRAARNTHSRLRGINDQVGSVYMKDSRIGSQPVE